jgi:protocatechuate 3,4-dioxygenase beta subunit
VGQGSRFIGASVLVVAGAGLGAWWLLREAEQGGAAASPARAAAPASAPAVLPALPEPLAADAPASAPAPLTARPEADAAAEAAQPGVPMRVTGRVVDHAGQPVSGATVRVLPSSRLLAVLGLRFGPFDLPIAVTRFPATVSAADGTFALDARDVPLAEASVASPSDHTVDFSGRWPQLLVSHPDYQATAHAWTGWVSGPIAAGDIVIEAGASVTGRAVDDEGRPLADVLVRPPPLYDRYDGTPGNSWNGARLLLSTTSGRDGVFRLDGLWPGDTHIGLEAPGRIAPVQELTLAAGEVRDLGDVVLTRGGAIEGWVLDAPTGHGVADARVLVRPKIGSLFSGPDAVYQAFMSKVGTNDVMVDRETHANAEGAFRVPGLDAATEAWEVMAGGPGYEPVRLTDVAANAPPVTLMLQHAGVIVLTVLDPDTQAPILDATIAPRRFASDEEYSYIKLEVVSGAAALAALGLPPPFEGVYALTPAGSHRNEAVVSAPGRATRGFQLPVVVAPEHASRTIHLARELVFGGRVLDADGAPIADARVTLHAPEDLRVELPDREARSDAEGRFRFDALLDGDWDLSASAPRFVPSEPRLVALRKGQAAPDEEIVLQHAGAIAGVVMCAGAPKAGEAVAAHSLSVLAAQKAAEAAPTKSKKKGGPAGVFKTATGNDGRFLIESLPPGDYELDGPPGVKMSVAVESGKTSEVVVQARRRPRVHGRVVDADGPVGGAKVVAARNWGGHGGWLEDDSSATCAADGTFELEVYDPERYSISARQESSRSGSVELQLDWDQDEWLELRFGSGTLVVHVVDETGAPVGGASVSLGKAVNDPATGKVSQQGNEVESETDAQGEAQLKRLAAGHYAITTYSTNHVTSQAQELDVTEGTPAAAVTLILPRAGKVHGVVKPAVPGAALPLPLLVKLESLDAGGSDVRFNVSDDGTFTWSRLAPGHWRCEIASGSQYDGPALASCEFEAAAMQTVEVVLQLP